MTISEVQFGSANSNASSGGLTTYSFASNVATGNTIFVWVHDYNTNNTQISCTVPHYNGAAVTGAVQLYAVQNDYTSFFSMFTACYMLPNVQTSGTSITFTITNNEGGGNAGCTIAEIAGLGAAPVIDKTSTDFNDDSIGATSGATSTTSVNNEFIVGGYMCDSGGANSGPSSPWVTANPSAFCFSGYQISSSTGTFTFSGNTGGEACQWSAGVAAIVPGIKYNTGTADNFSGGTSQNITIPSGVLTNDLMILGLELFTETNTAPSISFSGGGGTWTSVPVSTGSNPQLATSGNIYSWGYAFYRIATSSDPGATLTITQSGSPSGTTWWGIVLDSYSNTSLTNPIDVAGSASNAGSLTIVTPSLNTTKSGDWAIQIWLGGSNGTNTQIVPPSGTTSRASTGFSSGVGAFLVDSNGSVGAAGTSIGGGTYNSGTSAGSTWQTVFTIGIAPPSSSSNVSFSGSASAVNVASNFGTLKVIRNGLAASVNTVSNFGTLKVTKTGLVSVVNTASNFGTLKIVKPGLVSNVNVVPNFGSVTISHSISITESTTNINVVAHSGFVNTGSLIIVGAWRGHVNKGYTGRVYKRGH